MKRLVAVVALLPVFLLAGTYPLPRARGQDKPAPKPAWEWKAVAFGPEEKEATKKLNELAAGGWEYVGPLTHGLVAFKMPTRSAYDIERKVIGVWEWKISGVPVTVTINKDGTGSLKGPAEEKKVTWRIQRGNNFVFNDGGKDSGFLIESADDNTIQGSDPQAPGQKIVWTRKK